MTVRPVTTAHRDRWVDMRHALWPDAPRDELAAEADAYLRGVGFMLAAVFVAVADDRALAGFAEIF